ncbi:MAG TPA: DNA polymerase III subunit delta [Ruminococcus sp.]|nr:DNA polymerase III subunit delta [Ruminococcus sp.]
MAAAQYDDILKKIKSGNFDRLYYFYGKDIMSVEKLTHFLISKTDESGFQKFTGDNFNISQFSDYIQMFPMSADYNVIAVNDLNAENLSADDLKYLLETLEYIPETTVIIFYITGFDVKSGKKFPSPKNKKIIDFVSKHGVLCEMELKSVSELALMIIKSAEKQGCTINRRNAEKIVQLCLCNSMMIKNETDKLCSYAAGNEITSDMIDALVPQQLDSTVFNLAKAVAAFNLKKALILLDEVFLQQNDAVSVLAALSGTFIDFYRAKAALSCGKSENDVISDFNYKGKEFVVRNAFRDCRRMSESHLEKCLDILTDADKTIKSFSCNSRLITEQAVVKMTVREI